LNLLIAYSALELRGLRRVVAAPLLYGRCSRTHL